MDIYAYLDCSGVYGIRKKSTGKYYYIGSTKNIKGRYHDHRTKTRYTDKFHKDLRAHPDKYECVVLYKYDGTIKNYSELREKLLPIECDFIDYYKSLGHPLITTSENNTGSRQHTAAAKKKMKAAWKNPKHRKKMISLKSGKIWITNEICVILVTKEDYKDNYDHTIWRRGRKKYKVQ